MRKGISITVTARDRVWLDTIIRNRNSAQKHVWRARIIVLTADGAGTTAITRAVGKGEGVAGTGIVDQQREGPGVDGQPGLLAGHVVGDAVLGLAGRVADDDGRAVELEGARAPTCRSG